MTNTKWALDPAHSEVQFKVRHLMISTVTGSFQKFEATVETDGNDFTNAKIIFKADIDSISTNNSQRDGHLKSADFFDMEKYPALTFESDKMEKAGDEGYTLYGQLSMLGISKPITLHVEFGGIIKDTWGNTRAGFTLHGKLSRKDFGMTFNQLTETGGLTLSDEIIVHAATEFIQVKQEQLQAV